MAKLSLTWRVSVDEKGKIWRARTSTELFSSRIHPSEVTKWERSEVDTNDGLAVFVPGGETIEIETNNVSLEVVKFVTGLLSKPQ